MRAGLPWEEGWVRLGEQCQGEGLGRSKVTTITNNRTLIKDI